MAANGEFVLLCASHPPPAACTCPVKCVPGRRRAADGWARPPRRCSPGTRLGRNLETHDGVPRRSRTPAVGQPPQFFWGPPRCRTASLGFACAAAAAPTAAGEAVAVGAEEKEVDFKEISEAEALTILKVRLGAPAAALPGDGTWGSARGPWRLAPPAMHACMHASKHACRAFCTTRATLVWHAAPTVDHLSVRRSTRVTSGTRHLRSGAHPPVPAGALPCGRALHGTLPHVRQMWDTPWRMRFISRATQGACMHSCMCTRDQPHMC